jgi:quercetin dioxygenase-like cupin family protein
MKAPLRSLLLTAAIAFAVFSPINGAEPDPKSVFYELPDKIQWRKGEASDNVTLVGDPSKPGLYIQLTRWHPHNMSRPHSHSTERYITVLSGTWWVGTGPKYDPDTTYPMPAGSYVVDHANELHWDGAKDEDCVLEIVGMGPMTTTQAAQK